MGDVPEFQKISDANPQQAEYMWGHRFLFDFKNRDGLRLQGIIGLPDDYKQGEKRPMMVNFYFFQFFDHYLKDAPAPEWMTKGVSYLKKDANRDSLIIK